MGRSFHGLALNVDMDLEPFLRINPCGYAGMTMTQMSSLLEDTPDINTVSTRLQHNLVECLNYTETKEQSSDQGIQPGSRN